MRNYLFIGAVLSALLIGFFVGRGKAEIQYQERIVRDTLLVTEKIVEEVPVYKEVTREVHDTCTLVSVQHDTVEVLVPIEYRHDVFEQGEVYYHGFNAGVDSLIAYRHTQIVTIETTRTEEVSRWGIDLSGGYGIGKAGLTPYVGVGVSYRILSFPKRKKEHNIDYE